MPIAVPVLASQAVVTDLAAPMLAEPISQQSVAGAGAATVHSAVCHVTMTQIVSTLASLLQGRGIPAPPPASHSALYPLLTDDMFLPDLLQKLVLLLAPDVAAFITVFSPLVQHCQQEAASTQLVPVSAVVSVQADGCEDRRPAWGLAQ